MKDIILSWVPWLWEKNSWTFLPESSRDWWKAHKKLPENEIQLHENWSFTVENQPSSYLIACINDIVQGHSGERDSHTWSIDQSDQQLGMVDKCRHEFPVWENIHKVSVIQAFLRKRFPYSSITADFSAISLMAALSSTGLGHVGQIVAAGEIFTGAYLKKCGPDFVLPHENTICLSRKSGRNWW